MASTRKTSTGESNPERLRLLLQAVTDYAIYMLDPDGIVTSWNTGAERLKGYTEEEIIGQHFSRFFTPEDRADGKPARALETARRTGRYEEEGWRVRRDGRRFWALAVLDTIYGPEGEIVGFAKVTRDMTERREALEALRESEQRFRMLVEGIVDYSLFMLDPAGYVQNWNPGAERIKGYKAEEIIGRHFSAFYTEEDRAAGVPEKALRTAAETGKYESEGWRVRKGGERFWASVVIDRITDDAGNILGYAKITRDITERRDALEALRLSEQRFRMLVEGVVDYSLFMLDPSGYVQNWNPGAQRAKGYEAAEIVGRHFSTFYTEEDRAAGLPDTALRTAIETGKYESEGWRVRKGGQRFWASVVIDRITDEEGRLLGFAKITRDISDRRALEKAKEQLHQAQKLETVGQLTGGVAHDFNNLLTAMLGSLSLIAQMTNDARVKRLADTAYRAGERGAKLTSQLLAFSRRQTLQPQPSDLNELVSVFDALLRRAVGETVSVETNLEPELWIADVDQAQFQSALLNLVVNARDAMPGGGTLFVNTENVRLDPAKAQQLGEIEPGDYVVVAVSDTGAGMSEEVKAHAIEPFYTTKDVGKGSGLGLSQVYGFVRQSNGQLEIESKVGQGTTIRLYLPRSDSAPVGERAPKDAAGIVPRLRSVLVVEDDPEVLDVAVETLRSLGYQVFSAANAPEALSILQRDVPIDVLFTDVVMPKGMNGVELAREARRIRPTLQVLLASGYTKETLRGRDAVGDNMVFLAKPYQVSALAETLRELTRPED